MKLGIDLLQIIRPVVRRIEFRAFNHAGHYVFREHAQQVNQLITNFVKAYEFEGGGKVVAWLTRLNATNVDGCFFFRNACLTKIR
jgi:hypothetical protein